MQTTDAIPEKETLVPAVRRDIWWMAPAGAVLLLAIAVYGIEWTDWGAVGIMSALALATGLFAFQIGKNTYVNFSAAVFIATVALFGTDVALIVTAAGTIAVELACFGHRRKRLAREVGVQVIAVFAAGCAYVLTGGKLLSVGVTFVDAARFVGMFAMLAATSVIVRSVSGAEPRRSLRSYTRWIGGTGVIVEIAMLPLALLLAAAYMPGDSTTFPLLAVVLIVSSAAGKTLWETKESLEKRVSELKAINAVGQLLSSTLKLDELVDHLEESTQELFATSMLAVCLYDEESEEIEYRVRGAGDRRLPPRKTKPGDTLTGWVVRKREVLLVDDITEGDEERKLDHWILEESRRRREYVRTWLGIPLTSGERLIGVLSAQSAEPRAFGRAQVELLQMLANQVARTIDNAKMYEGAEKSRSSAEEWNRELEEKVEERTRELEEMRSELERLNSELEGRVADRTQELQEMQTRVVQSGRLAAVGEMAAGVAHELNNPLGGILGYAQLTLEKVREMDRQDLTDEEWERLIKHLTSIEKASQRCRGIVQSLLTFSQASQSAYSQIDIHDVVREALRVTGRQLTTRGIRLDTHYDSSRLPVLGDPYQLRQVFVNIIMNARDAMVADDTLTVRTLRTADEDGVETLEVAFEDSGCGIGEDDLPRVFEPFFTTRETGEGTGLGLSVSYGIIKDHEGQIEVESSVGEGTTFTVRLPLAEASVEVGISGGLQ